MGLSLIFIAVALATWACRPKDRPLSPVERALVGKWGRPETDPRLSFVTSGRLIMNPWVVQEFDHDRTYRQWIVSGVNAGDRLLQVQGRWKVVGGSIRFEDPRHEVSRFVEHVRFRLAASTRLPLAPSSSGPAAGPDLRFRLVTPDHLVLEVRNHNDRDWRRLSDRFNDRAALDAATNSALRPSER